MFALLPTPPDLAPWVRCMWTLTTAASATPDLPIAPDGCCEWVLHVATPPLMAGGESWRRQPREFVFGQLSSPLRLHGDQAMTLVSVRFQPQGVASLLRLDGSALYAEPLELAQLDRRLKRWHPTETHATVASAHAALIVTLRRMAHEARDFDLIAAETLRLLDRQPNARISRLSRHLGFSSRTLERRFRQATGLGMKTYARIQRMQQSLHDLSQPGASLIDIAYRRGFSDQAHLTRELVALAGYRPSEVRLGA